MAEDIWQNLPYPTAHRSVFQAGWVQLDDQWQQPELAETWSQIRTVRQEVNRVLEQARTAKDIGSSLEAKVLLYVPDTDLRKLLAFLNPPDVALRSKVLKQSQKFSDPILERVIEGNTNDLQISVDAILESKDRSIKALSSELRVEDDNLRAIIQLNRQKQSLEIHKSSDQAIVEIYRYSADLKLEVEKTAYDSRTNLISNPENATADLKPNFVLNNVDELRYLFLVSQVEVLDSPDALTGVKCSSESDALGIGVVDAEGQKCDRCWNYSTHVGESSADPTICDRCVAALNHNF
jgi:isoleucyl-tRNA synthetase